MSQIEKSVTHLLVATKQLLETLTQWSRSQAQEEEVSDVYVRLGYEFNLACRAFNSIGVETTDLGPVPDLLRSILEDTLSQPASPQSLDNYLPRIRDIIINLLHGLKKKQAKLRSRSGKDQGGKPPVPVRQMSSGSLEGSEAGLGQMLDNAIPDDQKTGQGDIRADAGVPRNDSDGLPGRKSSTDSVATSSPNRHSLRRDGGRTLAPSLSRSSLSSSPGQNMPVLPPYSEPKEIPTIAAPEYSPPSEMPPPTPPKQNDALEALQRGGDLERRASRRFSNIYISKQLGSPNGFPLISPSQNSPIPNRGRDLRESMNAVQSRRSIRSAYRPPRPGETSPNRHGNLKTPDAIKEESPDSTRSTPRLVPPTDASRQDSPTLKTPVEAYGRNDQLSPGDKPVISATINGPDPTVPVHSPFPTFDDDDKPVTQQQRSAPTSAPIAAQQPPSQKDKMVTPPKAQRYVPEDSPPPGKELTLFLQYKSKIKKFVLPDGIEDLTVARLQLAFIEKFAWNTHSNGVDLPEIYIQDPVSGVRHELEDLSDVKDRSVLVLNIEVLDEVKRHFDDGIGGLRSILEGVRGTLDGQGSMMERFSSRQLQTSKEMARISTVPRQAASAVKSAVPGRSASASNATALAETQALRRDLAVMRQTYATLSSDLSASMEMIKQKGANVKAAAATAALPTFEGNAGRAHVNEGKKTLQKESETLVNRVDELSDLVEDLRKDVVTRGVRPRPRQLEDVNKDISATIKELTQMKDFLKREKPIWSKIWEKELDLICQERDELTQQEDLMADLHGDLEDLSGVFKLVEEATKQQNLQQGAAGGFRSTSRTLPIDPDIDPQRAKDGVLGEVRALQPNHEDRLEAIERAEKLRQRELEARKGGEFQREVEKFVEEGKLKKTGGAEEVERLRKAKDEKARKENWDRAQQRLAQQEAANAEAAQSAPEATSQGSQDETAASSTGHATTSPTAEEKAGLFNDNHGSSHAPSHSAGQPLAEATGTSVENHF